LGGLAGALHLRSAGYEVTIIERQAGPGGRFGAVEIGGFRFDTGPAGGGPAVRDTAAVLGAVGERLADWAEVQVLDPICRAHYPDGTMIDVFDDPHRTAESVAAVCGGAEARAYLRWRRWGALGLPTGWADPRTRRLFGAAALFGYSPIGESRCVRGGGDAVARILASVCEKHGISIWYQMKLRKWKTERDRVVAVVTDRGDSVPVDAVVLPRRTVGRGPSCMMLHLGVEAAYGRIAGRNVHFGRAWRRSRHELLVRGELMRDPTIAVEASGGAYRVVVPVPDLRLAPMNWDGVAARAYAGEIVATLEARGYLDLGMSLSVSYMVTPAHWARQGMAYGIPFGDSSHARRHPALANVVYSGSGLPGGRRAAHWIMGSLS
jgi:phytoene desaturase